MDIDSTVEPHCSYTRSESLVNVMCPATKGANQQKSVEESQASS